MNELIHIPRILALDGGDVRGLSSLLILQKLMDEIADRKKDDKPALPYKHFDLICDTSTDRFIAIITSNGMMCNCEIAEIKYYNLLISVS